MKYIRIDIRSDRAEAAHAALAAAGLTEEASFARFAIERERYLEAREAHPTAQVKR